MLFSLASQFEGNEKHIGVLTGYLHLCGFMVKAAKVAQKMNDYLKFSKIY